MRRSTALALTVALLVVAVIVLAAAYGHVIGRVNANQQANTTALCALRSDLQTRVSSGERFLAKHPRGIPGIPAPVLQSSISGQRRTIRALSPLICPPSPRKSKPKPHH